MTLATGGVCEARKAVRAAYGRQNSSGGQREGESMLTEARVVAGRTLSADKDIFRGELPDGAQRDRCPGRSSAGSYAPLAQILIRSVHDMLGPRPSRKRLCSDGLTPRPISAHLAPSRTLAPIKSLGCYSFARKQCARQECAGRLRSIRGNEQEPYWRVCI